MGVAGKGYAAIEDIGHRLLLDATMLPEPALTLVNPDYLNPIFPAHEKAIGRKTDEH